jgi:hypothetical protein
MQPTTNCQLTRVTVRGGVHATYAMELGFSGSITSPGVRAMTDVVIAQKIMRLSGISGMDLTRCIFRAGFEATGAWASFVDCLIGGEGAMAMTASVLRGIRFSAGGDRGYILPALIDGSVDGVVFDASTNNTGVLGGDLIQMPSPGSARAYTVRNCLTTKSDRPGGSYGKLISLGGTANVTMALVENNTHFSRAINEFGMLGISETYAGRADMVQQLKHNLTVGASANSGVLANRDQQTVKDVITQGGIANNVAFNAYNGGTNPPGYWTPTATNTVWTSGAPEAVLDADPQFVDDTRNLATWYRSVFGGTPGTRAADMALALDELCKRNDDSGWNTDATIVKAYNWIRAGYAPTNPALKTDVSANNGGWIGAIEGVSSKFLPHLYCN